MKYLKARVSHSFIFLLLRMLIFFLFTDSGLHAQIPIIKSSSGRFNKYIISSRFISEGVAVGDVNMDGKIDIMAGNYWFEAPAWKEHLLHADTLNSIPGYSTSFLNFSLDVNGDGWIDLIQFDQPGGVCAWYENPKNSNKRWQAHMILGTAGNETPLLADVDKDGKMDIICNDIVAKKVIWLKSPVVKGDTSWQTYIISNDSVIATHRYTHGLGWGDINKDGRNDVIIRTGWWESPVNVKTPDWKFHPANFGEDCANMVALDADEDGDQDIISSSAHRYGIWWHEQAKDETGNVSWTTHLISKLFSQSHALVMKDINGDGRPDVISGKRYHAHLVGDPGTDEPSVLYWYEYLPGKNPQWIPHLIDDNSGIGNCFVVIDINKDRLPDIIVSNKKGVYFFEQLK